MKKLTEHERNFLQSMERLFKDRYFDEAVEKVDCEMRGKVYVKREQTIESPKGAKLYPEQKSR